MARELLVVWAGRHRRRAWHELCEEYRRRISRHIPARDVPVKVRGTSDPDRRIKTEAEALWKAVPERSWVIALDREGRMATSVEFARELTRLKREWPHPIAFLIGSDLGLDRELLTRARRRLSLGPMTLPHELARLVLYEQLYRAVAVDAGIKYHRQPLR